MKISHELSHKAQCCRKINRCVFLSSSIPLPLHFVPFSLLLLELFSFLYPYPKFSAVYLYSHLPFTSPLLSLLILLSNFFRSSFVQPFTLFNTLPLRWSYVCCVGVSNSLNNASLIWRTQHLVFAPCLQASSATHVSTCVDCRHFVWDLDWKWNIKC